MFIELVLSACALMTIYVGWRAASVPCLARRAPRWLVMLATALPGTGYVVGGVMRDAGAPLLGSGLEMIGATWFGALLLLFVTMLAADLATGFGLFFRRVAPTVRGWALVAGGLLAALALVQGLRAPVVRDYEVALPGLPPASDGLTLVFVSDLHLGALVGERWLAARIEQIGARRPDAIILGGDLLEGDDASEREMLPALGRLSAPLGVWAVAGNHEHHGAGGTLEALEARGVRVLRNQWRELRPGVIVAGVDGARAHGGLKAGAMAAALTGRPPGAATIVVSHMPDRVEEAAAAGAGLMLSGHTHDGQIWPFGYVGRLRFPRMAGRYDVDGMTLLVCRGTGTFGPRMRLWYPSEILRVTLRCPRP